MISWNEFCVRKAAGADWLIWTAQPGIPYVKPLTVNETGAEICKRLMEGQDLHEIGLWLGGPEEADAAEVDIRTFIDQLEQELVQNGWREEAGKEMEKRGGERDGEQ